MLEMLLDKKLLFVLMGILTGLGVVDKCIVSMTMKRMVEAAGSMSKSNHPLMRLVRAKFEHACMISDTVENVGVFVDKYLYEYKVCGLRLHTLRRLEKICAGLLIVTGLVGAGLSYQVYGMGDAVLRMGACGAGLGILVWLFHLTTDENYCMQMAKNYMVDYLENVCLHKYEKANQKERTGRRDSVIKKDETNDTKEEKAEKEDKTEQEEKEESVPVSGSGVVQMQRESKLSHRHQQQSLEEFHDLRNYVDGDSLQRVSWKHVARDQGWFVKRFEQEPNVQIQIIEYAKMPSAMHEVRLSMMMALVEQCEQEKRAYGMLLPKAELVVGSGIRQYQQAKKFLAQA